MINRIKLSKSRLSDIAGIGSPSLRRVPISRGTTAPLRITRYAYYAFIFSLPFEALGIGGEGGFFSLARLTGYLFVLVALLEPQLYLKEPPKALWCFLAYLLIYTVLGLMQDPQFQAPMFSRLTTLVQMLILFWLSYNIMRSEWVSKNALLIFALSCICLGILLLLGVAQPGDGTGEAAMKASKYAKAGRSSAFGENPNATANVLTLGLLALLGLAYSRIQVRPKMRLLAWIGLGILATVIVLTGSRGAIVAIIMGFLPFLLKVRGLTIWLKARLAGFRRKAGILIVVAIVLVATLSYYYEPVRKRWEQTITQGSLARREKIIPEAIGMFFERPFIGWGPVTHYYELGARTGDPTREPHNMYLYILLETGLLGGIPFFIGLWYCLLSAWKARHRMHSVLPLALVMALLTINMKGTWYNRKLFWIVLAYALVSGGIVALRREEWPRTWVRRPPSITKAS